ncbi:MAG: dUTP diphosphatase [Planctomycetota bacterium]|nr:MAG: dUTP diphosphatase [Planctomycetota bacterium]
MSSIPVAVTTLDHFAGLALPNYETDLAAGMDVLAACTEAMVLAPGQRCLVPSGMCIALPPGWEIQVRPRSGLAYKQGVTCLNTPGTIDADYRGEIKVLLINHGDASFTIERGMRIAQLVLAPVFRVQWQQVATLDDSARGVGGFGSTGI